jgi:hypothetical protein
MELFNLCYMFRPARLPSRLPFNVIRMDVYLLVGQGFLIIEASLSHSGTPQSVGLLWISDQPVAETST